MGTEWLDLGPSSAAVLFVPRRRRCRATASQEPCAQSPGGAPAAAFNAPSQLSPGEPYYLPFSFDPCFLLAMQFTHSSVFPEKPALCRAQWAGQPLRPPPPPPSAVSLLRILLTLVPAWPGLGAPRTAGSCVKGSGCTQRSLMGSPRFPGRPGRRSPGAAACARSAGSVRGYPGG